PASSGPIAYARVTAALRSGSTAWSATTRPPPARVMRAAHCSARADALEKSTAATTRRNRYVSGDGIMTISTGYGERSLCDGSASTTPQSDHANGAESRHGAG